MKKLGPRFKAIRTIGSGKGDILKCTTWIGSRIQTNTYTRKNVSGETYWRLDVARMKSMHKLTHADNTDLLY